MSFKLLSEINNTIEKGNVVDLPHTILEELDKEEKELPYFFEIKTESELISYVGVRQFTSEKDSIEIPYWLAEELSLSEGNQVIQINLIENVPKGKYIKLRPESEEFFNIPEYETCLETKLSDFPLLYQGQRIQIEIFEKKYIITVEEIEQDWEAFDFEKGTDSLEKNVINVIDTDINVDITNIFLKRKLEKELEEQEEMKRQALIKRELQKSKVEENSQNIKTVFNGEGLKLSEEKNPKDVRLARLQFLEKRFKSDDSKKS